jgi:hypothetical protein
MVKTQNDLLCSQRSTTQLCFTPSSRILDLPVGRLTEYHRTTEYSEYSLLRGTTHFMKKTANKRDMYSDNCKQVPGVLGDSEYSEYSPYR